MAGVAGAGEGGAAAEGGAEGGVDVIHKAAGELQSMVFAWAPRVNSGILQWFAWSQWWNN